MPALLVGPLAVLGMLLLLVLLPVIVPVAAVLAWWDRRRLRRAAAACARCGRVLGSAALDASDAGHRADLRAMQRERPYHLVHIVRRSQARCMECEEDHAFDRQSLTFRPIAPDPHSPSFPPQQLNDL